MFGSTTTYTPLTPQQIANGSINNTLNGVFGFSFNNPTFFNWTDWQNRIIATPTDISAFRTLLTQIRDNYTTHITSILSVYPTITPDISPTVKIWLKSLMLGYLGNYNFDISLFNNFFINGGNYYKGKYGNLPSLEFLSNAVATGITWQGITDYIGNNPPPEYKWGVAYELAGKIFDYTIAEQLYPQYKDLLLKMQQYGGGLIDTPISARVTNINVSGATHIYASMIYELSKIINNVETGHSDFTKEDFLNNGFKEIISTDEYNSKLTLTGAVRRLNDGYVVPDNWREWIFEWIYQPYILQEFRPPIIPFASTTMVEVGTQDYILKISTDIIIARRNQEYEDKVTAFSNSVIDAKNKLDVQTALRLEYEEYQVLQQLNGEYQQILRDKVDSIIHWATDDKTNRYNVIVYYQSLGRSVLEFPDTQEEFRTLLSPEMQYLWDNMIDKTLCFDLAGNNAKQAYLGKIAWESQQAQLNKNAEDKFNEIANGSEDIVKFLNTLYGLIDRYVLIESGGRVTGLSLYGINIKDYDGVNINSLRYAILNNIQTKVSNVADRVMVWYNVKGIIVITNKAQDNLTQVDLFNAIQFVKDKAGFGLTFNFTSGGGDLEYAGMQHEVNAELQGYSQDIQIIDINKNILNVLFNQRQMPTAIIRSYEGGVWGGVSKFLNITGEDYYTPIENLSADLQNKYEIMYQNFINNIINSGQASGNDIDYFKGFMNERKNAILKGGLFEAFWVSQKYHSYIRADENKINQYVVDISNQRANYDKFNNTTVNVNKNPFVFMFLRPKISSELDYLEFVMPTGEHILNALWEVLFWAWTNAREAKMWQEQEQLKRNIMLCICVLIIGIGTGAFGAIAHAIGTTVTAVSTTVGNAIRSLQSQAQPLSDIAKSTGDIQSNANQIATYFEPVAPIPVKPVTSETTEPVIATTPSYAEMGLFDTKNLGIMLVVMMIFGTISYYFFGGKK